MSMVVTFVATADEPDALDAQLAFHLAAGVGGALVAVVEPSAATAAVLDRHGAGGRVTVLAETGAAADAERRTRMARLAATELDAAWVIHARPGEFWWPRAESFADALAAVPPRYTIVQGLVRRFLPQAGAGPAWERLIVREALTRAGIEPPPLERALRPAHRALPDVVVDAAGGPSGGGHVPLRAWYPIEVLTYPTGGPGATQTAAPAEAIELGLADGSLARDTRLAEALRAIADGRAPELRAPDIVDDAAYAVECAAVREVDTARLVARLDQLEARIAELERGFRARVVRRLSRLTGGRRG